MTDFTATDFTATQGGHGVHVNSATIDTTPKRIVLVFDASKRVDKTQWNVQFQLAGTLLANSRSGDNFSIFLTPGTPLPFVSSDESRAALQRLMAARPKVAEKRNPIYDSLFAASKIFGAPRFGDSIVLIGFREDAKSKNKPDYVLGALIQGGIRLHTIDIADSGDLPYRSEFTVPGAIAVADPDEAQLFAMSVKSGGASRTVRRDRSLKDDPAFQHRLQVLYEGITRPYRLTIQLDGTATPRKLEVSAGRKRGAGATIILSYPKVLVGCPNASASP